MLKNICAGLLCCLFLACAKVDTIPMSAATGKALGNREIVTTRRESPDFQAGTVGKLVTGGFLVGGVMARSEGDYIIKSNSIPDPAISIAEQLREALQQKYGTKSSATFINTAVDDVQQICAANPTADLILDVKTNSWLFIYLPMNWSRYRVLYSASFRLIDNKTKTVIAEGSSGRVPDTENAPTKEELLANNAERLKQELKKATEFCVNDFKNRVFQIQ